LTVPHEWIGDKKVRIRVAYRFNRVFTRWCSKFELGIVVGANEHVSVIRATTTVVDGKRVIYRNVAARRSAEI
jgi:hypothetical protein